MDERRNNKTTQAPLRAMHHEWSYGGLRHAHEAPLYIPYPLLALGSPRTPMGIQ